MKKYIIMLLFFLTHLGYSQNVTQQEAEKVAQNFVTRTEFQTKSLFSKKSVQTTKTILYKNKPSYYVVQFNGGGYAIISAYDGYEPVLSYSETGTYNDTDLPPSYIWWMEQYSRTIDSLRNTNTKQLNVTQQWDKYKAAFSEEELQIQTATAIKSTQAIAPLLTSKWHQGSPYNLLCPTTNKCPTDYSDHCPTGCVATACAQVLRYWGYPLGQGFDWCKMLNSLDDNSPEESKQAVAYLIRDIGRKVGMKYCNGGDCRSSAATKDLVDVLRDDYSYNANHHKLKNVSLSQLHTELAEGRPVIARGESSSSGHAFVIDGFNPNTYLFHFNWGFGGDGGYFYIDKHTYDSDQEFLFCGPKSFRNCWENFDMSVSANSLEAIRTNPIFSQLYNFLLESSIYSPAQWYATLKTPNSSYPSQYRTIPSGKTAIYRATSEIILQGGFEVQSGATFDAMIIPCPYPCSKYNY